MSQADESTQKQMGSLGAINRYRENLNKKLMHAECHRILSIIERYNPELEVSQKLNQLCKERLKEEGKKTDSEMSEEVTEISTNDDHEDDADNSNRRSKKKPDPFVLINYMTDFEKRKNKEALEYLARLKARGDPAYEQAKEDYEKDKKEYQLKVENAKFQYSNGLLPDPNPIPKGGLKKYNEEEEMAKRKEVADRYQFSNLPESFVFMRAAFTKSLEEQKAAQSKMAKRLQAKKEQEREVVLLSSIQEKLKIRKMKKQLKN